jgi:FkbM family methyltransferase
MFDRKTRASTSGQTLDTTLASIMARLANAGRVIAVEPDAETFSLLAENTNINWLEAVLQPKHLALSDVTGELQLHRVANRSANTSIGRLTEEEEAAAGVRRGGSFITPCTTVDALASSEGFIPDIMKVDVEGAELLVLRGARRTIAASPNLRILMEWSPAQLSRAGLGADSLLDAIDEQGLVVHRLRLDGTEEAPASRDTMLASQYWNVVLRHGNP